jgi:hypothetical protein
LESVCTLIAYRGFESHSLRQKPLHRGKNASCGGDFTTARVAILQGKPSVCRGLPRTQRHADRRLLLHTVGLDARGRLNPLVPIARRDREILPRCCRHVLEEGLRRSEIKNLKVVPIGGRSLLATMDWVFYRGDGTLLKQWRQSYNLVRIDGRWQILLSTFHVA